MRLGTETNLCGDGLDGMEVLRGCVGIEVKLHGWDGYKICADGGMGIISVPVEVSIGKTRSICDVLCSLQYDMACEN